MINNTNIRVPKKYVERIKEIFHDDDGYWAYTNHGWRNGDDYALHVIHEYTQAELLQQIKWTEPCDCDRCRGK